MTRKAEYAVAALVEMALQEGAGWVASHEIAGRQGIPITLIAQLLGRMREAGWVETVRGPGGGVRLLRNAADITVREVVELFEGPVGITRCLVREGYCENQPTCPLRGVWARAQARMLEVLEGTSIRDLAEARRVLVSDARERAPDRAAGTGAGGAVNARCRRGLTGSPVRAIGWEEGE